MMASLFPLEIPSEQAYLLTAIVLGFLFGFSLERAGFGNARKLVGQFYLQDMTVFKVMFTGILVAMVGLYSLASFGLVDLQMIWINPTFVWAQIVGGRPQDAGIVFAGERDQMTPRIEHGDRERRQIEGPPVLEGDHHDALGRGEVETAHAHSITTLPHSPDETASKASSNSSTGNRWVTTADTSSPLWSIDEALYQVSKMRRP